MNVLQWIPQQLMTESPKLAPQDAIRLPADRLKKTFSISHFTQKRRLISMMAALQSELNQFERARESFETWIEFSRSREVCGGCCADEGNEQQHEFLSAYLKT